MLFGDVIMFILKIYKINAKIHLEINDNQGLSTQEYLLLFLWTQVQIPSTPSGNSQSPV